MKTIWPLLANYFFSFRIIIILLLPAVTFANSIIEDSRDDRLKQLELQIHQLYRRNVLSDQRDDQQDREIQMLQTLISENIIKQNNNQEIYASDDDNEDSNNVFMVRKRPARLLPSSLFRKQEKKPFIGPPSSCKDLNEIGHTLNGIYLVGNNKNKKSNLNHPKMMMPMSAIFCDFQGLEEHIPSSQTQIKQSRLGYVGLKSAEFGIHFYVQFGDNGSVPEKGVITFDRQLSNLGGGMNLKTGVFTAPKAGVYSFSFSISKSTYTFDYLEVLLRLNGVRVGHSVAGSGFFSVPVTFQSTLKLKRNDRIDLWKSHGDLHRGCAGYCHHFTGSLIEEDLTENDPISKSYK